MHTEESGHGSKEEGWMLGSHRHTFIRTKEAILVTPENIHSVGHMGTFMVASWPAIGRKIIVVLGGTFHITHIFYFYILGKKTKNLR